MSHNSSNTGPGPSGQGGSQSYSKDSELASMKSMMSSLMDKFVNLEARCEHLMGDAHGGLSEVMTSVSANQNKVNPGKSHSFFIINPK